MRFGREISAAGAGLALGLVVMGAFGGRYQIVHTFGGYAYQLDRWTGRLWYCRPSGCTGAIDGNWRITPPAPSAAGFLE